MTAVVLALGAFASPALAALDLLALEVAVGVVNQPARGPAVAGGR